MPQPFPLHHQQAAPAHHRAEEVHSTPPQAQLQRFDHASHCPSPCADHQPRYHGWRPRDRFYRLRLRWVMVVDLLSQEVGEEEEGRRHSSEAWEVEVEGHHLNC